MTQDRGATARWTRPIIKLVSAQRIIGFWHIGALGDYARISAEQYHLLRACGLYDASEKIVVGFVGGRNRQHELTVPLLEDPKFELFFTDQATDYEYPTLARVWQTAQDEQAPFLGYYFHTKGASLAGQLTQAAAQAWRVYMEYFNLELWEDCVAVLQTHETCGVELQDNQSHYSGNFWWATSTYLRRLPDGHAYQASNRHDRSAAEFYICLAQPRAWCFQDFTENLYDVQIAPSRYRRGL